MIDAVSILCFARRGGARCPDRPRRRPLLPDSPRRRAAAVPGDRRQRRRPLDVRLQHRRADGRPAAAPSSALFPYTTDDRLHDSAEHTGPRTILRVRGARAAGACGSPSPAAAPAFTAPRAAWPRACAATSSASRRRNLDLGPQLLVRLDAERALRVRAPGDPAQPEPGAGSSVELLDGLQNLLPAGVERRFQLEYSTLVDAYKEQELDPETRLALFRLASIPADAPEPSESLRATAVWGTGLPPGHCLLSARQLDRFRRGEPLTTETLIRGQRGCYFQSGLARPRGRRKPGLVPGRRRRAGSARGDHHLAPAALGRRSRRPDRAGRRRGDRSAARASWPAPTACRPAPTSCRPSGTTPTCCSTACAAASPPAATRSPATTWLASWPPPTSRCTAATGPSSTSLPDAGRPPAAAGGGSGRERPRPGAAHPGVPAADLQPPARRSQPALEPLLHRRPRSGGQPHPRLPGQLARHLPELGGARPLLPRLPREHDHPVRRRLHRRRLQPLPDHARRLRLGGEGPPATPGRTSATGAITRSIYLLRLLELSVQHHPGRLHGLLDRAESSPTPPSPTGSSPTPPCSPTRRTPSSSTSGPTGPRWPGPPPSAPTAS